MSCSASSLLQKAGNTKGRSISVPLTSCLTGLDFTNKNKNCQLSYSWFQTSQTGGQGYSDTSPFSIPCQKWVCRTASLSSYFYILANIFLGWESCVAAWSCSLGRRVRYRWWQLLLHLAKQWDPYWEPPGWLCCHIPYALKRIFDIYAAFCGLQMGKMCK